MVTMSAVALLGAVVAWADTTGSISGLVTDASGSVVPGVMLVATSVSTNVKHTTVTDSKGFYSFPALNVDVYNVTSSKTGFREFLENGVKIDANSAIRIDIKLQLGAVTSTVEVKSEPLEVETGSTQIGELIEGSKVTSVPLNGRSFIDLLALQPGVSPYQGGDTTLSIGASALSGDQTNGSQSVNGGRLSSNGFMVNGATAEEGGHNGAALLPNLDSIAEFRIITANSDAEYGNFSGGQVNVITKSGTNQFHGDVFEFLRNTDLDAKNFFSAQRGVFIQNQFGGTIGGPIKKDRVFFFADYQGTKQILGQTQLFPVPSTADRSGNLLDQSAALIAASPANGGLGVFGTYWANTLSQELGYTVTPGEAYYTEGCANSTQCVFPNAVIPQTAWSPVAANTLKYIPVPNVNLPSGPAFQTSAYNQTLTDNKGSLRMDATTHYGDLSGYYFFDQFTQVTPYSEGINIAGFNSSNEGRAQMITLGLTTTLSNSTLNAVRVTYLRDVNSIGSPISGLGVPLASLGFNTPWNSTGGMGAVDPALEGVPSFYFNNYTFGPPQYTLRQTNNTFQVADHVTKILGKQTLQAGADLNYLQIDQRAYDGPNGIFCFYGSETGLDFADYLIGAPTAFTQSSAAHLDARTKYFGVYAQDNWRVVPALTVNVGLRYEIMPPWYDTQNKLNTLIPGRQSQVFPGAPVGLVVPGDPGVPRTISPIKYSNFAPRFGLAYAPNATEGLLGKLVGSGKTSIRASYGLFYSAIEGATAFVQNGSAPFGLYYSAPAPTLLASPYIDRATGHNEGIKFPFIPPPANVSPENPDTSFDWAAVLPISGSPVPYPHNVVPYMQQFALSLQRQLGTTTVVSANYVGSVGRHLLAYVQANPGDQALCLFLNNPANLAPGSTPCGPHGENTVYTLANGQTVNGTRPTFGIDFGSNPYIRTLASSSFNSLQVSVKHVQKYVTFLVGYTYEKSLDNGSDTFDGMNPYNPSLSRALSMFDVPQHLVASYVMQLPFNNLIRAGGIARQFTAGWAVSGITTFASGQPVQLSETDDRSLAGTNGYTNIDVPNYANNGTSLYLDRNPRRGQPYFNPNYFALETLGQVGDAMRRFFSGPGINNFDMAMLKNTQIGETKQVQFRAEAFNIFNHAQFNNPSGNINNSGTGGFGYVTSARDPRIMQIALKFLF